MDTPQNLLHAYSRIAQKNSDAPALMFPEAAYSHDQFFRLARAFAIRLRDAGVDQNATVCLDIKDIPVVLAMVLASSALGAKFAQTRGDLDMSTILPITHWIRADVTADDTQATDGGRTLVVDASWSPAIVETAGLAPLAVELATDMTAPWLVVNTSGTTGYPKFLLLTQQAMYDSAMAYDAEFGAGETRVALMFPPINRAFMSRALAALLHGSCVVDSSDPVFWAQAGVNMVASSPKIAERRLAGTPLATKIPLLELAGGGLSDGLAREFLHSFDVIDIAYGANETNRSFSNRITLDDTGAPIRAGRRRDSTVEIIAEDGTPCPPGVEGMVRVKNGYMASGYLTDHEASKTAFRDGWFYPGDIARWGERDELQVLRRDDDVFNIGGSKVHARGVERILVATDGITDAACFLNPKEGAKEELFAFVVIEDGKNPLQVVASAKYGCGEKLGPNFVPRVLRPVAAIPRKANGHPDRALCAQQVLDVAAKLKPSGPAT